jgi:hypothetical protein
LFAVTGTRHGITKVQRKWMRQMLTQGPWTELRHGACVGADEETHHIAKERGMRITIHPPTDTKHQMPLPEADTTVQILPAWGKYLADHMSGAKYVELPGRNINHFVEPWRPSFQEIAEFLTGHQAEAADDRVLVTAVFTDIVDSTRRAAEIGDRDWHALLDANESTWAFVFVGRVGWNGTLLVKSLVMLASIDGPRSYCGRTADEHGGLPARRCTGMDRAGPLHAIQSRRRHGIASAQAIWPSKPSVFAMSRRMHYWLPNLPAGSVPANPGPAFSNSHGIANHIPPAAPNNPLAQVQRKRYRAAEPDHRQ